MRQLIAAVSFVGVVLLALALAAGPQSDSTGAKSDPDTVRWAQDLLYRAGYYDGEFTEQLDAPTVAAIELFQKDYLLDPTGGLDPTTVKALERLEQEIRASYGLLDDIG
jgi:peptidoglycan hydrolase-like protein with peptidoglycan-binding domain